MGIVGIKRAYLIGILLRIYFCYFTVNVIRKIKSDKAPARRRKYKYL